MAPTSTNPSPRAMAYRRAFAHRFLSIATVSTNSAIPSITNTPSFIKRPLPGSQVNLQTAVSSYGTPRFTAGDAMMDRIRDSIRTVGVPESAGARMYVDEVKKVLRAWQMEEVMKRLRGMGSCISHSELVRICGEVTGTHEAGADVAQLLDGSGAVIVVGNLVFLQPDRIARAIAGIIPAHVPTQDDEGRKELERMEEEKVEIEAKAEAQVTKELWLGLGLVSLQTAALFRLTFWELSWDEMEPICFFLTSLYFISGYAFFLRTAREPSFEGFFRSRFGRKQRRLMEANGFDVRRFHQLKRAYYGSSSSLSGPNSCSCDHRHDDGPSLM